MYMLYDKSISGEKIDYSFNQEASFFGCNNGWIPYLLRKKLHPSHAEPFQWHLNIPEALFESERRNYAFVIDIKPHSSKEILMAELLNVWGHSEDEWTPLLLQLNYLNVPDGSKTSFSTATARNIVYTHAYASGSVNSGEITGKWLPASPSATNGALLTPGVLKFFYDAIKGQNHEDFG